MRQQSQIKRTLAQPEAINIVHTELASNVHRNRASLSRVLCQHFNLSDARGHHQIGGCNKALRELERAGHFVLPASIMPKTIKSPRCLGIAVPDPVDVPAFVGAVQRLALIKVDDVDSMRIWNEQMLREYPIELLTSCRGTDSFKPNPPNELANMPECAATTKPANVLFAANDWNSLHRGL